MLRRLTTDTTIYEAWIAEPDHDAVYPLERKSEANFQRTVPSSL